MLKRRLNKYKKAIINLSPDITSFVKIFKFVFASLSLYFMYIPKLSEIKIYINVLVSD